MENIKTKKNAIVSGLAVLLAAALLIGGGTWSYLQSTSKDVVNTFDTNKVDVSLEETTGNEYNIIPGTSQDKDPKVKIENSVDAYVYVKVTDNTQGLVTYEIADGWEKLDGYDNVYYREVNANDDAKVFSVLKDDKVSYSSELKNIDMVDESGNLLDGVSLTFSAYAIQKAPFSEKDNGIELGYIAVSTGVAADDYLIATSETLKNVLNDADDGDAVILSDDIELSTPLTIDKDLTIVGNGETSISKSAITTKSNVVFKDVVFESPENSNNNATMVYGQAGTENLSFEGCTFSNPQWEVVQITAGDFKSLVINNCTFNANDVKGASSSIYGNTAAQAIRYIHIQPNKSDNVVAEITITNNTFNDIANVKDSIVGIYYLSGNITVGGNTFSGWAENDVTNGVTPKLSVGWPEVDELKTISLWENEPVTYSFPGSE